MSEHDIKSHIKVYWNVFFALIAFTAITVGVSFYDFGSVFWTFFVGLAIACIKGYLVAGFFMHLNNEQKSIYYLLGLAAIFLMVLLSIPIMWRSSATNTDKDWLPYVSESEYVKAHEIIDHTESHDKGDH